MRNPESISFHPDEKDCPCGNYPNGDCQLCLTEKGKASYKVNLDKQITGYREEDEERVEQKPEMDNSPESEVDNSWEKFKNSSSWKNLKGKLGIKE